LSGSAHTVAELHGGPSVVEPRPGDEHQPARIGAPQYREAIRAFGEVAMALGEAKDLDSLLHLIARHICELAEVRRCSVYLRDAKTGLFRGQIGHADSDIDARIKRLTAGIAADRFTREIVDTKRPVVISNALEDPRPVRSTMREWKIRSMLGVPMVLDGEVIGIFFLDNEDQPHAFSGAVRELCSTFADLAAVAIAQAQTTVEMRETLQTVTRQNDLLRRAARLDDRFAELTLTGADLRDVTEAVTDLTAKPAAVYDTAWRRRTLAVPANTDEGMVDRLLEPLCRDALAIGDGPPSLSEPRAKVVGPLLEAGLHHRYLLAPVVVRESLWGHVVVVEYGGRFGALDMHIARRAATTVALELSAEGRAATAESDARASLASELIRGDGDEDALHRRADFLGIDLASPHVLCLISSDELEPSAMPPPRDVALKLAEATGNADVLCAGVAEGVIGIVRLEPGQVPAPDIAAIKFRMACALERLQSGGSLVAALSSPCTGARDLPAAYAEACQALACRQTYSGPSSPHVIAASELGAARLFLASADRTEANRFARDTLGALLGDEDGTSDLLATLRAFLAESFNVRASAAALGVHENTIRYRLARIHELTGLEVAACAEDRLTVHLALRVLELGGQIPHVTGPLGSSTTLQRRQEPA
jgi:sugar diacid utilization regulator